MQESLAKHLENLAKEAKEQGQKLVDITDKIEHKDYGNLEFDVNSRGLLFEGHLQINCIINGYNGKPFDHKKVHLSVSHKSRFTRLKMTQLLNGWEKENANKELTSHIVFKLILEEDDKE